MISVLLQLCYVRLAYWSQTVIDAVGALEDGIRFGNTTLPSLASYESNVLYALRFMVDTEMGGGQWLEIKAGQTA